MYNIIMAIALAIATAGPAAATSVKPAAAIAAPPVLRAFLGALQRSDYDAAYALLTAGEQVYYRSAANYGSIFSTDQFRLGEYKVEQIKSSPAGKVALVQARIAYLDHAHDKKMVATVVVPYGIVSDGGSMRIKDPGHPWKARAITASAEKDQLRISVKKIAFFAHRVQVVVTFANLGENAITLLPYGRTVLRDDRGQVYRIIAVKDWSLTDRTLFLGLRLAPSAQYTGVLSFEPAREVDQAKTFDLVIAPALRDGADAPFDVEIAAIAI